MKPGSPAAGPSGARRTSVLVTDDDPTQRMLSGAALDQMEIVEAEHGLAAVQKLEHRGFDLLILDLDMPVMDGYGVIEWARARPATRHLPIIVVTGRDDVVAIERAYALGATSFLCKPINWNVFRHQVAYVLRVAEGERDLRDAKEQAERQTLLRARALSTLEREITAAVGCITASPPPSPLLLRTSAQRLRNVLDRVRHASDILAGGIDISREIVRCADLATEAIIAAQGARPETSLETVLSGAEFSVACDRKLSVQALTEVLTNALHFAAGEAVNLRVVDAPPDRVRFEVEDRGPGIPEQILEGLNAPTEVAGDSPGLGLLVAKAIVELNGGHFGVMSEPGIGTEVFLSFPRAAVAEFSESAANAMPRIYASALSDT